MSGGAEAESVEQGCGKGSLRMGVKFFGVFALGVKISPFLALNFHIRFSKPGLFSNILRCLRVYLRSFLF